MKKIAMMMAALTIAAAGFGQHRGMHHQGHHGTVVTESLKLDSSQYATVKGINKKYHEQAQKLRSDTSRSSDARRSEIKLLREAREKEISGVLTPEQRKKLESMRVERADGRGKAVQARHSSRDEQIKSKLSIDDKKLQEMRKARKESFDVAQQEYEKKLKTILTEEQFDEWKEMQGNRSKRQHYSK